MAEKTGKKERKEENLCFCMLCRFISKLNPNNFIRIMECLVVSPLFGFIKLGKNEKEESKDFGILIVYFVRVFLAPLAVFLLLK